MRLFYKLLLSFFAISIIPLFIIALLFFKKVDAIVQKDARSTLEVFTELKTGMIESFLDDCQTDLGFYSDNPTIRSSLAELDRFRTNRSNPVFIQATLSLDKQFSPLLSDHQHNRNKHLSNLPSDTNQYFGVVMLDQDGRIIYSNCERHPHILGQYSPTYGPNAYSPLAKNKILTERLTHAGKTSYALLFCEVIKGPKGAPLGAIILHVDIDNILNIINDHAVLGKTGETFLFQELPDHKPLLVPPTQTHNKKDDLMDLVQNKLSEGTHLAVATDYRKEKVLARSGATPTPHHLVAKDYRGEDVLACWKSIPMTSWGFIAEMSLSEVQKPSAQLKSYILLTVLGGLLAVALFGYILARFVSRPILNLCKGAKKIREGNLHHPIATPSKDEIGELSRIVDGARRKLLSQYINMEDEIKVKTKALSTALKKTQEKNAQLTELSDELLRSNLELDDFAYIASHDLKEPLRSISNFSSFLLEDNKDNLSEEGIRMLNVLISQSARLEAFLTALLTYSRAGREKASSVYVDMNKLVGVIRQDLDFLLHEDPSIKSEIVIETPLPTLRTDPEFVKEILMNLVSNALKYNNSHEKIVSVGYLDEYADIYNVFYVKDNGIGIEERHFEEIFKIFRRIHGRDKYGGGSGAGLTIVKKKIDALGGQIWVESSLGMGTVFYFTLGGNDHANNE